MNFIDEVVIEALAGDGGNGCVAFRREKFVPRGGPAGGDGGNGGSVCLVGSDQLNTLYHLRGRRVYKAERGRNGEGSNKSGRQGREHEITVPLGTRVHDAETGELLGELLGQGERLVVAAGGRGGRGNFRFRSSTNQAPTYAQPGTEGEERTLRLELRLLADVGLVGLPNAGKSTLISRLSAARPKVADYPFTTLVPQLGVVGRGPIDEPFVIADLPGLIAGAAEGAGLGHQFLRHVERCRVLLHMVDLSVEGSAQEEIETIEAELASFNPKLLERQRLLVGSKLDSARDQRRDEIAACAESRSLLYFELSAVTGEGLDPVIAELGQRLDTLRAAEDLSDVVAPLAPLFDEVRGSSRLLSSSEEE